MGKKNKLMKSGENVNPEKLKYPMADAAAINNTVVAFISDRDEKINAWFNLMEIRTEGAMDKQKDEDIACIESPVKLPLCENLSQIINGLALQKWGDAVTAENLYDTDTEEEMEIGAISYIARTVIVRRENRCITYMHIKPMLILDLSPCVGVFSSLYIDLCSGHSPVFKLGEEKDRRKDFRCIPFVSTLMSDLTAEDWIRVFSNYVGFAKMWGGICCPLEYTDAEEEEDIVLDSTTKTIAARYSPVRLPDITEVFAIDTYGFLVEESM